jgi:hypothetical protein
MLWRSSEDDDTTEGKCTEHIREILDMAAEARDTCRIQDYSQTETSRGFKTERGRYGSEVKGAEAQEWIANKHDIRAALLEAGRQWFRQSHEITFLTDVTG